MLKVSMTNVQAVPVIRRRHGISSHALSLIEGLSAASLFIAGALPAPKTVHTSIASDWQAIGNDLRQAATAYGKKRHA